MNLSSKHRSILNHGMARNRDAFACPILLARLQAVSTRAFSSTTSMGRQRHSIPGLETALPAKNEPRLSSAWSMPARAQTSMPINIEPSAVKSAPGPIRSESAGK